MWKTLHASATGTSHELTGQPCQDYCDGRAVPHGGDAVLIAACADGAGSAEHSSVGARLAVDAFLSEAEAYLEKAASVVTAPDAGTSKEWARLARTAIYA